MARAAQSTSRRKKPGVAKKPAAASAESRSASGRAVKTAPKTGANSTRAAASPILATNRVSTYSVHPAMKMVQDWIDTLKEKTGRNLHEWIAHIQKSGPRDLASRRAWLKAEHEFGSNTASWLAQRADEGRMGIIEEDPDTYLANAVQYVNEMYPAPKAALRPLHDALIKLGQAIGKDVRFCPCKTMVPFYRKHVIAQIKPSTRTRIDFGVALGNTKATGRLIDTGGFAKKDRITHRIEISSLADIDKEVRGWLQVAYERDAK